MDRRGECSAVDNRVSMQRSTPKWAFRCINWLKGLTEMVEPWGLAVHLHIFLIKRLIEKAQLSLLALERAQMTCKKG